MLETIVIYCHGYNSSAGTDKVQKLKDAGLETYAWDINVDPDISLDILYSKMDDLLENKINSDFNLVFLGTSLGAWYAAKLAYVYGGKAILVNPAYSPSTLLPTVGANKEIAAKYSDIIFAPNQTVFAAKDDELINFSESGLFDGADFVVWTPTGGHRFNGKEFDLVIENIKQLR